MYEPSPMVALIRSLRWRARVVTCSARALPDFLIIGAPRAGTTSLYHYLVSHPRILAPFRKESHFFSRTPNFERGTCYYRANFPLASRTRRGRITGEATPTYLLRPNVPERIAATVPDAKLIVLLRDPVERAISSWYLFSSSGAERRPLYEAMAEELDELGGPGSRPQRPPIEAAPEGEDFDHIYHGLYADNLTRWFEILPRDRFLIMLSQDLFADPRSQYERALDFLGVPGSDHLPEFRAYNALPRHPDERDVRPMLKEYFKEPNQRLSELLQIPLNWDG